MTEENTTEQGDSGREPGRDWFDEAEDALERAGIALSAAWDASREARMAALESAKRAARQLGDAIDRGAVAARERWGTVTPGPPQEESTADEEE